MDFDAYQCPLCALSAPLPYFGLQVLMADPEVSQGNHLLHLLRGPRFSPAIEPGLASFMSLVCCLSMQL